MTGNNSRRIVVTIYRFTGQHGPFHVPHHKCVECDLSIALVNRTVEEIGQGHIDVRVKSWFLRFWEPLVKGGWHAPIVTIDGKVFSQGVVPDRGRLRSALLALLERRGESPVADLTT